MTDKKKKEAKWQCENCGKVYKKTKNKLDPLVIAELLGADEITNPPDTEMERRAPTARFKKSKLDCCKNPKIVKK